MYIKCALKTTEEKTNELVNKFLEAMSALQQEDIKIELDEKGYEKFKYASLKSIISSTKPFLNKHGFFFLESTSISADKNHEYKFTLMHKNGCYIESDYASSVHLTDEDKKKYSGRKMAVPACVVKDTCQPIGMEHTYFNRYARCNMLGLTGDDADIDKLPTEEKVVEVVERTTDQVEKLIDKIILEHPLIDRTKAMDVIKEIGKNDMNVMYATAERAVKNATGFISYYDKKYNTNAPAKEPTQVTVESDGFDSFDLQEKIHSAIDVLMGEEALKKRSITREQVTNMITSIHPDNKKLQLDTIANAIMNVEQFYMCNGILHTSIK